MEKFVRKWIVMNPLDDVATALVDLPKGMEIEDSENGIKVCLEQSISFGHKFSIRPVAEGGFVHKYGQVIGVATTAIAPGQHVHVQNVDSCRGRGDLAREENE